MTKTNVHIFIGEFENRKDATSYTEAQWEPEPDSSVTDEEYEKWEEKNPIWLIQDDYMFNPKFSAFNPLLFLYKRYL